MMVALMLSTQLIYMHRLGSVAEKDKICVTDIKRNGRLAFAGILCANIKLGRFSVSFIKRVRGAVNSLGVENSSQ